jgi:hypothetical protein
MSIDGHKTKEAAPVSTEERIRRFLGKFAIEGGSEDFENEL